MRRLKATFGLNPNNVHFWPKAYMRWCTAHIRYELTAVRVLGNTRRCGGGNRGPVICTTATGVPRHTCPPQRTRWQLETRVASTRICSKCGLFTSRFAQRFFDPVPAWCKIKETTAPQLQLKLSAARLPTTGVKRTLTATCMPNGVRWLTLLESLSSRKTFRAA